MAQESIASSFGGAQEGAGIPSAPGARAEYDSVFRPSAPSAQADYESRFRQISEQEAQTEIDNFRSQMREEATRKANEARGRFEEQHGYDRMGKDPSQQTFDEFDSSAPTPARAGPGLGVSPGNALAGVGAGIATALMGAAAVAAKKPSEILDESHTSPGPTPTPAPSPSLPGIIDSLPPLPPPMIEHVDGSTDPPRGQTWLVQYKRRRNHKKAHFPFLY